MESHLASKAESDQVQGVPEIYALRLESVGLRLGAHGEERGARHPQSGLPGPGDELTVIFPEFAPRRIPARLTLKATILSPKVAKIVSRLGRLKYLEIDPKSASGGSQTTLILCHLG